MSDINYANYTKYPTEPSQITGWVVLISKGSIVQQVVGTPTGRLLATKQGANALAKKITENTNVDATALALVSPASLTDGVAPDWTGGMTSEEYVSDQRNRGQT